MEIKGKKAKRKDKRYIYENEVNKVRNKYLRGIKKPDIVDAEDLKTLENKENRTEEKTFLMKIEEKEKDREGRR